GQTDGEGNCVWDAVSHVEEFYGDVADLNYFAGFHDNEVDFLVEFPLFQPFTHHGAGEGCAVNGAANLSQNVGECADVVFVGVGQQNAFKAVAMFEDIADVRYYEVNSEQLLFGEGLATVYGEHVVAVFKDHHIHADFAYSA